MTPLHVRRTASRARLVDELATRAETAGPGALLADLDRSLHRVPLPRLLGRRVVDAYGWERADAGDPDWWPQGVTTADDARALGGSPPAVEGRRVAIVTWYAQHSHGVRLTVVDLDHRRYRHVLLVKPVRRDDGSVTVEPVKAHAGGIVWAGSWLHVAATGRGCVSAHLDDLMWLPERDALGRTFGYRWVLPTRVDHRGGVDGGSDVERLRWSFLSLDRGVGARSRPGLLVGEYGRGSSSTRLARFPLDDHGLPVGTPGAEGAAARTTHATDVVETGVRGMQGVARVDGRLHVTTSHGPWTPGSLVSYGEQAGPAGDPAGGTWRRTAAATPMGPEDLSWSPAERRLWTPTEHPHRRWLVALRPED